MKVLSRLRTATPLQVNLQVRIAEVNRSLLKEISGSLLTSRNPALGNGFLGSVIRGRSEEHTSELQSLMRISYAVFCLKKKKQKTTQLINQDVPSTRK